MDKLPGVCPLDAADADAVIMAALQALESVGVRFTDRRAQDLLAGQGARVDTVEARVYLPPAVVRQALSKVRPAFDLYSRDGRRVAVGGGEVRFSNSTYDSWVLDYRTLRREASTLAHVERFVRLNDALGAADIVGAQVVPQDVPAPLQQIKAAEAILKNTPRPFVMNFNHPAECETVLRMAAAVAGSEETLRARPMLIVSVCPDSPLRYEAALTRILTPAVRRGVPVGIGPCPILGISAPMTLAGALTQSVAEALAGVVLVKALNPECPLYLGITPFTLAPDGHLLMGSPEGALLSAAYAQVCRRLGVPNSFSCTHTDSRLPTVQTGYEKAMGLMLALASGSPLVQAPAILDDGNTTALAQLVLEADLIGAARRLLQGVSVSEETLAVEAIRLGAGGEAFVTQEHTLRHLRSEAWQPAAFFRGTWEQLAAGANTAVERAIRQADELLAGHEPTPLPVDAARELEAIVREAAAGRLA